MKVYSIKAVCSDVDSLDRTELERDLNLSFLSVSFLLKGISLKVSENFLTNIDEVNEKYKNQIEFVIEESYQVL